MERMQAIESRLIPLDLTNSNDGQGRAWFSSAKERTRIEQILIDAGMRRKKPFKRQVRLRLTRILGPRQRLWDPTNFWRGNTKQLVDALVALNWFTDDSRKYIAEPVEGFQDASQRDKGPAVLLEVFEA